MKTPHRFVFQDRALRLQSEMAFKVLARAQALEAEGRKVIHLEIGQPDFPTPPHICEAAAHAMREGKTGYGPAPGLPELRRAIAEDAGRRRGLAFRPEQVVVTCGAKPILFYTINSLAGVGDEVIYPDPGFPMYASIAAYSGARPVPLPLRQRDRFRFDPDEFRSLLSDRTRLVIINSPQNPTGGLLEPEDLQVVAEEAIRRGFTVLSDEVYINILYGGRFASIASLPGMAERTVVLDGFSKTYSMTGWRLGYGILPLPLVDVFENYNLNIISCPTTFTQYGALAAIAGSQEPVRAMVEEFRKRRDFLVERLNRLPGVECLSPGGAFYAFPDIRRTGLSAEDLAGRLLEEAGVAALPGTAFGIHGEGHLRLSYANSLPNLAEAMDRMEEFLKRAGR
jgi:aspartate/methionine/tyrosine aminotransferase